MQKGLIELQGYNATEHNVTTEDGYILTLYRISPTITNASSAIPVFLMHGILGCSTSWVWQTPQTNLGMKIFPTASNNFV
jgi:lysosomal acid lipase/cholesteryl ester hydrolase